VENKHHDPEKTPTSCSARLARFLARPCSQIPEETEKKGKKHAAGMVQLASSAIIKCS